MGKGLRPIVRERGATRPPFVGPRWQEAQWFPYHAVLTHPETRERQLIFAGLTGSHFWARRSSGAWHRIAADGCSCGLSCPLLDTFIWSIRRWPNRAPTRLGEAPRAIHLFGDFPRDHFSASVSVSSPFLLVQLFYERDGEMQQDLAHLSVERDNRFAITRCSCESTPCPHREVAELAFSRGWTALSPEREDAYQRIVVDLQKLVPDGPRPTLQPEDVRIFLSPGRIMRVACAIARQNDRHVAIVLRKHVNGYRHRSEILATGDKQTIRARVSEYVARLRKRNYEEFSTF